MKKTSFYRIYAMLILCAVLFLCLPACKADDTGRSDSDANRTSGAAADPERPPQGGEATRQIPSGESADGITLNIAQFAGGDVVREFGYDGSGGDIVSDRLYKRERSLLARLDHSMGFDNVNIHDITGDPSDDGTAFIAALEVSEAGGAPFDVIVSPASVSMRAMTRGLLFDLNLIYKSYIDLNRKWWQRGVLDELTMGDSLYFVTGDISYGFIGSLACVFYDRAEMGDLYAAVADGSWTADRFFALAAGRATETDDAGLFSLVCASGFATVVKDSGGMPAASDRLVNDSRAASLISSIFAMRRIAPAAGAFDSGGAAMAVLPIGCGGRRDNESGGKYGILPLPKYRADQPDYITPVGTGCMTFSIAAKCPEPEAATLMIECLAADSERELVPAQFALALHQNYRNGGNDAAVYDIMRRTAHCDLGLLAGGYSDEMVLATVRAMRTGRITPRDMSEYKRSWERIAEKLTEISRGK